MATREKTLINILKFVNIKIQSVFCFRLIKGPTEQVLLKFFFVNFILSQNFFNLISPPLCVYIDSV